jgi:predicted transcriptional regulator
MYLAGATQTEIANEYEVSQSMISKDLKAIRKQWLASAVKDFDTLKAQELARIDRLEKEYWNAWFESKEDAEETRTEVTNNRDGRHSKAVRTSKGQTGNAQYLAGIQWCIEQRLKIFGVYSAVKVQVDWRERIPDEKRQLAQNFFDAMVEEAEKRLLEEAAVVIEQ